MPCPVWLAFKNEEERCKETGHRAVTFSNLGPVLVMDIRASENRNIWFRSRPCSCFTGISKSNPLSQKQKTSRDVFQNFVFSSQSLPFFWSSSFSDFPPFPLALSSPKGVYGVLPTRHVVLEVVTWTKPKVRKSKMDVLLLSIHNFSALSPFLC